MKIIKTVLFACCIWMVYHHATAQQQVTIEEAQRAATQFVSKRKAISDPVVEAVYSLKRENHTLMYEVIFDDRQGVLLSGSKACQPILGFFNVSAKDT